MRFVKVVWRTEYFGIRFVLTSCPIKKAIGVAIPFATIEI